MAKSSKRGRLTKGGSSSHRLSTTSSNLQKMKLHIIDIIILCVLTFQFTSRPSLSTYYKLIDILGIYGVSLSQLSYIDISIMVGLIIFFRDHGAVLTLECFSSMSQFICDT
ncbi:hypothetical protein IEQ34_014546 [Dendrobium chrysotoxum]|uniref:Uncharacterized protein n=1 Tax=Dendrobium chrysotoxum TaxID=161865 RepID=A0AAV7GLS5_DENCH|nr:hypothetical protein IEQ34_014546 [Dendrobium chrysotoxum]